ncbi:MAG: hypothetical protein ACJ8F1_21725 [Polyangia bacterium]
MPAVQVNSVVPPFVALTEPAAAATDFTLTVNVCWTGTQLAATQASEVPQTALAQQGWPTAPHATHRLLWHTLPPPQAPQSWVPPQPFGTGSHLPTQATVLSEGTHWQVATGVPPQVSFCAQAVQRAGSLHPLLTSVATHLSPHRFRFAPHGVPASVVPPVFAEP